MKKVAVHIGGIAYFGSSVSLRDETGNLVVSDALARDLDTLELIEIREVEPVPPEPDHPLQMSGDPGDIGPPGDATPSFAPTSDPAA